MTTISFIIEKHPKCKGYRCNHPLDPVDYACGYASLIDCDECKYNSNRSGRKDPGAKVNQPKRKVKWFTQQMKK